VNQPQKLLFVCTENRMRSLTADKMSAVSVRNLPGALC
jgi:protein-tyrosine-phosphatase